MGEATAMQPASGRRGFSVTHALLASLVLWIMALGISFELASGNSRAGLIAGVVAAIVSGVAGLVGVQMTAGQSFNTVLLGRVVAFFLRGALVAVGVLVCMKGLGAAALPPGVGTDRALAFVCSFFPLFFVATALEHFASVGVQVTGSVAPAAAAGGAR